MARSGKPFPLLEIATAIVVLTVIGMFGVPKWKLQHEYSEMDDEVGRLYNQLIVARNTAVTNRHQVSVSFNAVAGRYTVHEDINRDGFRNRNEPIRELSLEHGLQFGNNPEAGATNIWGTGPLPANPVSLKKGGSKIFFSPKGKASHNGALYLIPTRDIGDNNQHLWAIRIYSANGEIKKLRYTPETTPQWN